MIARDWAKAWQRGTQRELRAKKILGMCKCAHGPMQDFGKPPIRIIRNRIQRCEDNGICTGWCVPLVCFLWGWVTVHMLVYTLFRFCSECLCARAVSHAGIYLSVCESIYRRSMNAWVPNHMCVQPPLCSDVISSWDLLMVNCLDGNGEGGFWVKARVHVTSDCATEIFGGISRLVVRWGEMRWGEMRWDEMRWGKVRWDEWSVWVCVHSLAIVLIEYCTRLITHTINMHECGHGVCYLQQQLPFPLCLPVRSLLAPARYKRVCMCVYRYMW